MSSGAAGPSTLFTALSSELKIYFKFCPDCPRSKPCSDGRLPISQPPLGITQGLMHLATTWTCSGSQGLPMTWQGGLKKKVAGSLPGLTLTVFLGSGALLCAERGAMFSLADGVEEGENNPQGKCRAVPRMLGQGISSVRPDCVGLSSLPLLISNPLCEHSAT